MRKKVVIFSAFFPPDRHIAVSRVEAYAKYLATDHDITVITFGQEDKVVNYDFGNGTFCKVYYVASNNIVTSLLFYTGQESRFLHKLKTLFRVAFNHLNMSHFSTWAKKSKKILEKELENNKIDVLISSYAPEDILEVSYQVLSNLSSSNIKWVVDMRDEYSDEIGLTQWIKEKRRKNELKYSEYIDLLITVSEPLVDLFKRRMPKAKEYIELRNGFDHNYEIAEYKKDRILKIGYFGSLHGDARPDIFFLALQELKLHNKVQVFFAVRNVTFDVPSDLKESVIFLPFMSYIESIKKMSNMDANLLILPSKIRVGVYSGKVFDYLSARRSVLALVNPNDVAAKLLDEVNSGYIADFNSLSETKMAINKLYEDWENNNLKQPCEASIAKQHRKYQVQVLSKWISRL